MPALLPTTPVSNDLKGQEAFDDLVELSLRVCAASGAILRVEQDGAEVVATAVRSEQARAVVSSLRQHTLDDLLSNARESAVSVHHVTPVRAPSGVGVGVLAVVFDEPRALSDDAQLQLWRLSRQAVVVLEQSRFQTERERWEARRLEDREVFDATMRENRRFEAVLDLLPDVAAIVDVTGRVAYLNGAGRAFWGDRRPAQPRLSDLCPPGQGEALEYGLTHARRHGVWKGDNVLLTASGDRITVAQTIIVVRGRGGDVECVATLCRDVTQHRHQEALLREREERFRHLVEDLDDVLFEQDAGGRWTFLNPAWTSITGLPVEECLGRPYQEFLHPDDAPGSKSRFESLLSDGRHDGAQASRYVTHDGTWRWLEARVRRNIDEAGELVGTHGTLRDITARRAMADELSRAHQQALRSSAMMSEFLANMSHEIRTPLNGVLGLTTLLLDSPLADEQRAMAASAQRSAETLLALVNDILDISKIESGNLTIERVPFEMRAWAEDVTAPGFARARAKHLDVSLSVDPQVPARLIGDPTRTRQILTNLIDNAVKFTERGAVGVDLTTVVTSDGRRMVRVAVTDSGIGIPADKHGDVFEKYRQADSSTTRKYGGTGLGLAICRQLAAGMDGEVGLDSEVGHGSTFWFTIPLVAAPAPVEEAPVAAPTAGRAPLNPRVLLAEDNPTNQFVARRFLEKCGCRVEIVENGSDAVARVQQEHFDVVFMDCQMPVMDGYEATRRIRQLPAVCAVPIVAMTAHAMAGDREKCLAAGMTDYVSKPLKPETIEATLWRVLNASGGRGEH